MFGTVIIDAYRKEEALEMAEAIDDLCGPNDNYGWASAGIYCFWDYYIEEILYIALAFLYMFCRIMILFYATFSSKSSFTLHNSLST